MNYFEEHRKSYMETGKICFWAATINNWYKLLSGDATKQMITGSLSALSAREKITVYAFVIMPIALVRVFTNQNLYHDLHPHEPLHDLLMDLCIFIIWNLIYTLMNYFEEHRKSYMEIGKICFWTATINNWHKLLSGDATKQMIISSLSALSARGKIIVYAFVIMPNHIHLIWQMNALNGKETAQGSFLKFTAHAFKDYLVHNDPLFLPFFSVKAANKSYEFWQRDPLAIELTQKKTVMQKLQYIHDNPLAAHWQLADEPAQYYYSSAKYYETGIDDFGFLNDITAIF